MDDIADEMIQEGCEAEIIQSVTGMAEDELAERYLENGYSIRETADELGLDDKQLLEDYGDDYDYE